MHRLGKVSNKFVNKLVEFSTKGLTPPPPSVEEKKKCKLLSITRFSENFEKIIIICHILKDMTIEIKQAGAELGQAQYKIG